MNRLPIFVLLLLGIFLSSADAQLARLKVSDDHRRLTTADGKPFFYLGDTAWELFHRLTREEADRYLEDRARKGFTVIQAVALAEFSGLTEPNRYGQLPLVDNNPANPRDGYFQHVDYIVDKAATLGMYTGLLPTWGDKVNKKWGQGPEIFTPENARAYGEWLGKRYRDKPIIWILGGDRACEKPEHVAIFRALAEGLRKGDGGAHLMTYHPQGGQSSSQSVQNEPWLDFHMMQSGHGARNIANYKMIAKDLALTPPRPTLDGEPAYEDHPVRGDKSKPQQWFDEWDVRKLCYWGLLAGACGHTYGTHSLWSFWDGKGPKLADQRTPWIEALALPGSSQVGYARRLMESRPSLTRMPDQSLIVSDNPDGAAHYQAARDAEGTYALIYSASGAPFTVALNKLTAKKLRATWWNPREGAFIPQLVELENDGQPHEFHCPDRGDAHDWLLVLDDVTRNYPLASTVK